VLYDSLYELELGTIKFTQYQGILTRVGLVLSVRRRTGNSHKCNMATKGFAKKVLPPAT
jgi:hypothetical protein